MARKGINRAAERAALEEYFYMKRWLEETTRWFIAVGLRRRVSLSDARAQEPRIKQCESVKAAAAEISNTPRAQVDGKVYAKVFGIQNKSIMNMTADEFRHVQNMKKGDLVRDMWTEEMNSGAFFMNCVFRAAVAGGEDPVAAMERISRTMTPTFRGVGLHDQASTKRPREFLVHNKEMRESRHASHSTLEVPSQHSLKRVLTTNGDP
eukprot:jgi/Mesvir1/24438/Mv20002-RA.1